MSDKTIEEICYSIADFFAEIIILTSPCDPDSEAGYQLLLAEARANDATIWPPLDQIDD